MVNAKSKYNIDKLFLSTVTIIFVMMVFASYGLSSHAWSDTNSHIAFANGLLKSDLTVIFYPLWHITFLGISFFCGENLVLAAAFTNAFYTVLSFIITRKILLFYFPNKSLLSIVTLFSFILMILGPIVLEKRMYLGIGTINIYHNPTYIVVKPFALLTFYFFIRFYDFMKISTKSLSKKENKDYIKYLILFSVTMIISLFAKPSFLQFFIVGMGLFLLVQLFRKQIYFSSVIKIGICFIPSVLIILFQYFMLLSTDQNEGIIFSPFTVLYLYNSTLFSLLLLLLFPLFIFFTNLKDLKKDDIYLLTIICYVLSLIQILFFAESGKRLIHGNLLWGYYLATMLLWTYSIKIFIQNWLDINNQQIDLKMIYSHKAKYTRTIKIGFVLLFLHLISGIVYYYRCTVFFNYF